MARQARRSPDGQGTGGKQNDPYERRRLIAQAAGKAILKMGLEAVTLRKVAQHLGCTTGVIQHYFASKEEMLLFAKNISFDEVFARMRAAAESTQGLERLKAMALEALPRTEEDLEKYRLLTVFRGRAIGNARLSAMQRKRDEEWWQYFEREIRLLRSQGLAPSNMDPVAEAVTLTALIEGLALGMAAQGGVGRHARWRKIVARHIDRTFVSSAEGCDEH